MYNWSLDPLSSGVEHSDMSSQCMWPVKGILTVLSLGSKTILNDPFNDSPEENSTFILMFISSE